MEAVDSGVTSEPDPNSFVRYEAAVVWLSGFGLSCALLFGFLINASGAFIILCILAACGWLVSESLMYLIYRDFQKNSMSYWKRLKAMLAEGQSYMKPSAFILGYSYLAMFVWFSLLFIGVPARFGASKED